MRLRKKQRLMLVALALLLVGGATGLTLAALQDKVAFFVTPSDIAAGRAAAGNTFRVGGLVAEGSVHRLGDGTVQFALTDTAHEVSVTYKGILPDLFREKQGIVAEGTLEPDGTFRAAEVLAKHDENYMPKEVADALKKAGYWQANGAQAAQATAR
jgi:cytochrome c-type biogenesis protein CcmE